ncbi:hypothetical protein Tco_0828505 [Tanacetum coccineum]
MAQPQRQADVHQDELCSPNKCYALMDANKKIDLDNPFSDDLEAEQNVEKVKEHLAAEEIEKMVEGTENVDVDEFVNSILDSQNDPRTRNTPSPTPTRSPRIHYTSLSSVLEKLQELTVTDLKLSSSTPSSSSSKLSASQRLFYLLKSKTRHSKQYKSFFDELKGRYSITCSDFFGHLKMLFMPRKCFAELATYLQEIMQESLPSME